MRNWWHSLVSVIAAAAISTLPGLQGTISHHPVISSVLGFAWAILGHLLPSPLGK